MGARALPRPGLHDALVLPRRFHHHHALVHRDARRLFDIDVFPCFAAFHCHVGMPVVRRGNADCIDRPVGQDLAEIAHFLRLVPRPACQCHGALQIRLIHIAHRAHRDTGLRHSGFQILRPHDAHADERDRNPIARRIRLRQQRCRGYAAGRLEKSPSPGFRCWHIGNLTATVESHAGSILASFAAEAWAALAWIGTVTLFHSVCRPTFLPFPPTCFRNMKSPRPWAPAAPGGCTCPRSGISTTRARPRNAGRAASAR